MLCIILVNFSFFLKIILLGEPKQSHDDHTMHLVEINWIFLSLECRSFLLVFTPFMQRYFRVESRESVVFGLLKPCVPNELNCR